MYLPDLARWMRQRGLGEPVVRSAEPAVLPEHALVWNYRSPTRRGGAANVVGRPGAMLHGVVLEVDRDTFAAIDRKEGHPGRYSRGEQTRTIRLPRTEEISSAWVYEVTPPWRHDEAIWPRAAYLRLVVRGAIAHGLPAEWVETLESTRTIP